MRKYLPGGVLLLLALALYLPTLRTGFLTDDFLDCNHSIQEVPAAFLHEAGGGYRPLMVLSWATDNGLWGITRPWGWHLTNIIILTAAAFSLRLFLRCFIKSEAALLAGIALLLFSTPTAVSVARISWRTTILTMIPFLLSAVMMYRGGERGKRGMLTGGGILFFVSLLLKESFLAGGPVLAAVALCTSREKPWKNALKVFGISAAAFAVYAALRYTAMGWNVNYTESSQFGLFMAKNILIQNAAVWRPWLSGISARILFLFIPVIVYFSTEEWKHRVLVILSGIFLLIPVSNLSPRIDLAIAALPATALTAALFTERYGSSWLFRSILLVLFTGVILNSRDELRLLKTASDTLNRETEMIAEIARDLPGSGPVFISGVTREVGGYGTYWPGEYMMPLRCAGIEPSRNIYGTNTIWEQLILSDEAGYIVFLEDEAGYSSFPVSKNMYSVLSDTGVYLRVATIAGDLSRYPSCILPDLQSTISFALADSVFAIAAEEYDGEFYADLASSPEWLCADSTWVLFHQGQVTFTSRNIAFEKACIALENKSINRL